MRVCEDSLALHEIFYKMHSQVHTISVMVYGVLNYVWAKDHQIGVSAMKATGLVHCDHPAGVSRAYYRIGEVPLTGGEVR